MTGSPQTTKPLLEEVYGAIDGASKAIARIAQYVVTEPEDIQRLSISDLAERSGSGQASVVRFCRMLGFDGYADFKIALTSEIEREKARRFVYEEAGQGHQVAPELRGLSGALQTALADTSRLLDPNQLKDVAARLKAADRVELFGVGVSAICADLLSLRLIWQGIFAHSTNATTLSIGFAQALRPNSVAIGISYGGVTEETRLFLENARRAGAYCLAVTTRNDSPISKIADDTILLSAAGPWPEAGSSRLVPSMVLLAEYLSGLLKDS